MIIPDKENKLGTFVFVIWLVELDKVGGIFVVGFVEMFSPYSTVTRFTTI